MHSLAFTLIYFSPLEQFEVVRLVSLNIGIFNSLNLSITNLGLYTIITAYLVLSIHIVRFISSKVIPSRWTVSVERAFDSIHGIVKAQIGQKNEIYFPFIYSLFFFLLIGNIQGNVPYGFTITTRFCVRIGLSVAIFLGVTILAIYLYRTHFFSYFLPSGTPIALIALLVPIEFISYVSRAFSLGIRIFANIVSGHTLLKILGRFLYPMFTESVVISIVTLIPFSVFTGLVGLEIAVRFIQAYVFSILTCRYLKDAINLH